MSKLSPALKELINAPFARPGTTKAPAGIGKLYEKIAGEAHAKNLGPRPWVVLSVRLSSSFPTASLPLPPPLRPPLTEKRHQAATTFTLNSPDSLAVLHHVASSSPSSSSSSGPKYRPLDPVPAAELIREVGLKCISFNGIPRSINSLGAFRASLAPAVQAGLATSPSRLLTADNLAARQADGRALWASVYDPFDEKLERRLAESHPDLPVHILGGHYAQLLSDPSPASDTTAEGAKSGSGSGGGHLARTGRVLTSVVAIAALRAQTGVGPQVLSHVFGLRKAVDQGFAEREAESSEEAEGIRWLAGDEGCEWVLRSVDSITEAVGNNFASKL